MPQLPAVDNTLLLRRALALAAHGFWIFPVRYDTKIAAVTEWPNRATRDTRQIREWFATGKYNIGIHGGKFGDRKMVVLDVDVKEGKRGMESLVALQTTDKLPATMTTHTPTGGLHLFFQTDDEYRNSSSKLGDGLDIRSGIAKAGYVVGPGSFVGGPYKAKLTELAELPQWFGEKLKRAAAKPTAPAQEADYIDLDTPAAIERATAYLGDAPAATEGDGGDATTFAVACRVMDFGVSAQGCVDLMLSHWNDRCDPPWDGDELRVKVANARKYRESAVGSASGEAQFGGDLALPDHVARQMMHGSLVAHQPQQPSRSLGPLLSIGDMMDRPPPRQIVRHIWPEKGVAFLGGETRHMKTFTALSLAMAVVTGKRVGDLETIEKKVLFTLNEGQNGFGERCQAWLSLNQMDRDDVAGKFIGMENTVDLMRDESIEEFFALVDGADLAPGVVVIDTFSKATIGADDNSTQDMARAIGNAYRIADRWGGLVVLIDHVGKDAKRGIRGAYAKVANVDAVGMVRRKDNSVTLHVEKMKDGEDGKTFQFQVEMQGGVGSSDRSVPVVVPSTLSVLPSQSEFIVGHLVVHGATSRDELSALFCEAYDVGLKSFRMTLSRLVRLGDVADDGAILSYNRIDF
jgi:hypothetical protein